MVILHSGDILQSECDAMAPIEMLFYMMTAIYTVWYEQDFDITPPISLLCKYFIELTVMCIYIHASITMIKLFFCYYSTLSILLASYIHENVSFFFVIFVSIVFLHQKWVCYRHFDWLYCILVTFYVHTMTLWPTWRCFLMC